MHKRLKKIAVGVAALAAMALGGGALAQAGSAGDKAEKRAEHGEHDGSLKGRGAGKAKAAALRITGGGHANAVERDGENGATWEVEVTKPSGKTVDVRLDQNYKLVVVERDGEG